MQKATQSSLLTTFSFLVISPGEFRAWEWPRARSQPLAGLTWGFSITPVDTQPLIGRQNT